jgi:hypothetical protein
MLPYALGLLGLRYVLEVLHNTRRPLPVGLLGRSGTYETTEYIDRNDKSLSLIVFNFTEYLTSTLCINLPFGYLALDLLPQSIYLSATPLSIIVPSICLIAKPSVLHPRLLPKNQP